MNWKVFTAACFSFIAPAIPQNIIGCGPSPDPYDDYVSFFNPRALDGGGFEPFYYVQYNFLYSDAENSNLENAIVKEWAAQENIPDTRQVNAFIMKSDLPSVLIALQAAQGKKVALPDSLNANLLSTKWIKGKETDKLTYLYFAKKIEPQVYSRYYDWVPNDRNQNVIAKLITDLDRAKANETNSNLKMRYDYQLMRLAYIAGDLARCGKAIADLDQYNGSTLFKTIARSYEAGINYKQGKKKLAAYQYAQAFAANDFKNIANFTSFNWAVSDLKNLDGVLALAKNNREKANILALDALSGGNHVPAAIEKIYELDPQNKSLQTIIGREINMLEASKGSEFEYRYRSRPAGFYTKGDYLDPIKDSTKNSLFNVLNRLVKKADGAQKGLFYTSLAYVAVLKNDFELSKNYANSAQEYSLNNAQKDQLQLISLLNNLRFTDNITPDVEAKILPQLKWITQKADAEKNVNDYRYKFWTKAARDIFSAVMAARYERQGDLLKTYLALLKSDYHGEYSDARYFLRNKLTENELLNIYAGFEKSNRSDFEKFMFTGDNVKKGEVAGILATQYLRVQKYDEAVNWLGKSPEESRVYVYYPFRSHLKDRVYSTYYGETNVDSSLYTTKIAYAKEMARLQKLVSNKGEQAGNAENIYKYACGLYNVTYYGPAWMAVRDFRSGVDGYYIDKSFNSFELDYYGCFAAQKYFEAAERAFTDPEMKARALFMQALCAQKQVPAVRWSDYTKAYPDLGYEQISKLTDADEIKYQRAMINNKLFPAFQSKYSNTRLYKEALGSCSYLSMFVRK